MGMMMDMSAGCASDGVDYGDVMFHALLTNGRGYVRAPGAPGGYAGEPEVITVCSVCVPCVCAVCVHAVRVPRTHGGPGALHRCGTVMPTASPPPHTLTPV